MFESIISFSIGYYGDLRIIGGTESGQLEFYRYRWGIICKDGFDDDAGDVACRQLGYARSSDVYVVEQYVNTIE